MISRWNRWGPLGGLLLCITWSPMAIAIPRLPDLDSARDVQAFWRSNQELMQGVILSVSVGFLFLLMFLGALVELVRTVPGAGAIAWIVLASALMFMTALNVALGLDIAGGLIVGIDPAGTYALHTAAFLLAAPAAFAGATFFVVIAVFTWESRVLPLWSAWVAVMGVIVNAGAVLGSLTLTGPLNSGNGIVGGIAAPLGLYLLWVFSVSVWWLRRGPSLDAVSSGGTSRSPQQSAPAGRA
jgi:hypothetical protein